MHIYICSEEHASLETSEGGLFLAAEFTQAFTAPRVQQRPFYAPEGLAGFQYIFFFIIVFNYCCLSFFVFLDRGIHMGLGPISPNNYA